MVCSKTLLIICLLLIITFLFSLPIVNHFHMFLIATFVSYNILIQRPANSLITTHLVLRLIKDTIPFLASAATAQTKYISINWASQNASLPLSPILLRILIIKRAQPRNEMMVEIALILLLFESLTIPITNGRVNKEFI